MARAEEILGFHADINQRAAKNVNLTLGAGTVHSVARPTPCRGVRLTTALTDVLFAVDEDPDAALTASSDASVAVGDLGVGNLASDSEREVRLITGDEIRLVSATGGVVLIEFFH